MQNYPKQAKKLLPLSAITIPGWGKRVLCSSRPVIVRSCMAAFTMCLCLLSNTAAGYVYGEHKLIGDRAFYRLMQTIKNEPGTAMLLQYLEALTSLQGSNYNLTGLSAPGALPVTYGTINGLAGDHQSDPVLLEAQLKDSGSIIQKIISLHQKYLDKGMMAAPDGELVSLDLNYALAATGNLSHFYAYGKTFPDHLKNFDSDKIREATDWSKLAAFTKSLGHTNAIRMYVSLHLVALTLAEMSGRKARQGDAGGPALLQSAIFINAFADHFLEDAFSAGHLIVNRTVAESFTNNKALHDFYCENGTTVVNRKGEIWYTYGDGKFDENTTAGERAIAAVTLSIQDLFTAFSKAASNPQYIGFLDHIPQNKSEQPLYLIRNIPALSCVPIPYNSKLDGLMAKGVTITVPIRKANQLLYYRNFIRSRVGNSIVIGTQNEVTNTESFRGFEIRVNAFNFSKRYKYNSKGGKKGMLDYWHGYTASYDYMKYNNDPEKEKSYQVAVGLRSNFDYWLSEKRFLGLYTYLETGVRFQHRQPDLVFIPSIGIHLGSLFNINYYSMPGWLRIPAMYLLPLKVRAGSILSLKNKPVNFAEIELDLFL